MQDVDTFWMMRMDPGSSRVLSSAEQEWDGEKVLVVSQEVNEGAQAAPRSWKRRGMASGAEMATRQGHSC